jgi:hypothetical protein
MGYFSKLVDFLFADGLRNYCRELLEVLGEIESLHLCHQCLQVAIVRFKLRGELLNLCDFANTASHDFLLL